MADHQPGDAARTERVKSAPEPEVRQATGVETAFIPSVGVGVDVGQVVRLLPRQVARLQRTAGNRAVADLVAPPRRPVPHRVPMRSSHGVAQRDGDAGTTIMLDGKSLSTAADLASWYRWEVTRLKGQRTEMTKDGVPPPIQVDTAAEKGNGAIGGLLGKGSAPLEIGQALAARIWFEENFVKAMNAAEAAKGAGARKRMQKAKEAAERAADRFETVVLPAVRRAQEQAFRAEDESKLAEIAEAVAGVVDTGLIAKNAAVSVADEMAAIERMENAARGQASLMPTVNGRVYAVLEVAEKLNTAYAKVQIARDAVAVISAGTKGERAAAGVKAMVTTVSAGGTLLGATAGMSLYANLWLGPAVDACLSMVKKIERATERRWNKQHMQLGDLDAVNWEWEPGGRPVFEFMVTVMHADDAGGVPTPVPGTVSSFFVERADDLEAGAGGQEVPTTGFWFWEEVDQAKIGRWVFRNRNNIWGMLYGDAEPP